MENQQIVYTPSFAGKAARLIIPALNRLLPQKIYKLVYNLLYKSYKYFLYVTYVFKYIFTHLSFDKKKIKRAGLTLKLLPYTMGGRKALENAFDVINDIEMNGVKGDIVECGVAEGGTAAMLALSSLYLGKDERKKWFFDSYEGLPEPTAEDYENGKAGMFIRPLPKGSCLGTIEQVSELLFDKLKLNRDKVVLVKGWFQDTVPQMRDKVESISVLRLDGDWYESTKIPLENFYDKISSGGYVIIDDYATCYGSSKAVDEFRTNRGVKTPLAQDGRGGVYFQKP